MIDTYTPSQMASMAGFETARREDVELSKKTFRQYTNTANRRFQWYRHNVELADVLERVVSGEIKRLMVFEPPRHGKSEQVSRLFSSYYLYCHPERWVGLSSYAFSLAKGMSRNARSAYVENGGVLNEDAQAVDHWETQEGGGMWAAGVGGPITGKGGHLLLIDDPLKNAKEAESETIREAHKDWYRSTLYTRQEPDAAIVVVMTRWNPDDLAGWLLNEEYDDEPEGWYILNLPAIAEEPDPDPEEPQFPPTCTVHPDWREPGEALCPERYPLSKLRKFAKRLSSYWWSALFQQRPTPREGGFFKRAWFKIIEITDVPRAKIRVRGWDQAATEGDGDYTAGTLMQLDDTKDAEGEYHEITVLDHVAEQLDVGDRDQLILAIANQDGRNVHIRLEQEPGSAGKSQKRATTKLLSGYTVHSKTATGDKKVRAGPYASAASVGLVKLVRAPWNARFIERHTAFPTPPDDDVDSATMAWEELHRLARRGKRSGPPRSRSRHGI